MTDAEITALIVEIATLKKQVSDKDDVIAKLNDELTRLLNKVFGHTSEKHLPFAPAVRPEGNERKREGGSRSRCQEGG